MSVAYSLIAACALLAASPWLLWQALRHGKYRDRWTERIGALPASLAARDGTPTLWLHAVSVGEVLSAAPLVAAIQREMPTWRVVVSVTTKTGRAVAEQRLRGVEGVFYFPLDFAWIVRRVLARLRPSLVVIVETEIWPTLTRLCRTRGIGLLLVNARISDRSFPRYRRVRRWLGPVLGRFDRLCAQSDATASRLRDLGAPPERVVVTGSLKYDVPADPPASVADVAVHLRERPVLLAASTLEGEDQILLDALRRVRTSWPSALLVIAPRHPERFADVAALAAEGGWRTVRRTALASPSTTPFDVLVLDTIGELAALCAEATVVFVGGSLVPAGGHNILEPARFGRPIVVGPSMSNFAEIAQTFLEAAALVQVPDGETAQRAIADLFDDPDRRQRLGEAARGVLDRHRGAVGRTMRELREVLARLDLPAGGGA